MSSFVSLVDRSFSRKQPSPSKSRPSPVQPAAPGTESTERPLFGLEQLEVDWEEETGTLWTFMRPHNRPSYNPEFLKDFEAWQIGIQSMFAGQEDELRYLVLGSRWPGVYSLGGDLDLFARHIRDRDREALVEYGRTCVRILHRNIETLDLPVVTIALAQGDALGGGFESLLSFNVVIAERGIKFGFPESLFGLFPGMGAYSLLARRIGAAKAEEMILSGNSFTAEEMHDLGIVHILAEPGEGVEATRAYIQKQRWRRNGSRAVYMTGRQVDPLPLEELERIVEIWADACLLLSDRDLRLMERLVAAQDRLRSVPLAAE
ncbi:crotonase/enoyl-CoA hydratase family protein [Microbaculum marinisediminis]|uniref:crotonase/enoyl-CoA hydratase family protein n=1 Tax=Microbaculum marinisediminis TaxID=2931392 RepID=UPI0021C21865|nr:crotonase/enoyl-CoA hydratase family protein [Microbaculum sp. A6E488]